VGRRAPAVPGRTAGDDAEGLRAAASLYRGDLLEGLSVPGAPLFEEWVTAKRAEYRGAVLPAPLGLVIRAGAANAAIDSHAGLEAVRGWI
jgi:hypothetical protein